MLPLPESGVRASMTRHNCDLQLFCDWVEGCLLFKNEERLSRTDIVDILCEQGIYKDQTFASEWLDNVWNELERRQRLLRGATPFDVNARAISGKHTWKQVPEYAFCVLTPLLQASPKWLPKLNTKAELAAHYAQQGLLFERICDEALKGAGWQTHRTAWSRMNAARLPEIVTIVAQQVGEPEYPNWTMNVSPNANEAGLDIVFFRVFYDKRCGFPVYLTQCATGADWDTKLHTPVVAVWRKLVDFAAPPHKAFALPHSLGAEELRRVTVKVEGIVFDRYRLHDSSRPQNWCSRELTEDLKAFLSPLIANLPSDA
jgi:hypothetical protein